MLPAQSLAAVAIANQQPDRFLPGWAVVFWFGEVRHSRNAFSGNPGAILKLGTRKVRLREPHKGSGQVHQICYSPVADLIHPLRLQHSRLASHAKKFLCEFKAFNFLIRTVVMALLMLLLFTQQEN
jgi:hypothetical protein